MFLRMFIAVVIMFGGPVSALCQEAAGQGSSLAVSMHPTDIRQGDVVTVRVRAQTDIQSLIGWFNGREVYFAKIDGDKEVMGILGIDMTFSPGTHHLLLEGSIDGRKVTESVDFDVKERKYEVERLNFPGKMVELDKGSEERTEREANTLRSIWEKATGDKLWDGSFVLPVSGKVNGNFGRKRVLNGKEKSPHNGIDIGAPEGKDVISPNGGRVALVDNQFFGGNTVVLDHGLGLYTTYLHLSEVLVKEGDVVRKGDVIGRVGETGRSKGPHLHWSARLYDARIDPLKLLDL